MSQPLSIQLPRPVQTVRLVAGEHGPAVARDTDAFGPRQEARDRSGQTEALKRQLEQAVSALHKALETVTSLQKRMIQEAEGQLIELALEIARKVLMQEIQAERFQIDPIVKEALARIPPHQEVSMHLHPKDLAQCQASLEAQQSGGGANVRYVADPSVPRAECVLRTAQGMVVSSIEGNLQCLGEALTSPE